MTPRDQVSTIRTFLAEFMDCSICRKHVLLAPYDPDSIVDHRQAVLWLWRLHNDVNDKVYREVMMENAFTADPGFPRLPYWPTKELCPLCIKREPSARMPQDGTGKVNS